MAYALLIVEDPARRRAQSLEEGKADMAQMVAYSKALHARGVLTVAEPLKSAGTAHRVTVRNGRKLVLDGPFSEAKEMVGGIFVLNCATRDEALAIAAECPAAEWAAVEVREIGPCYEE